MDEKFGVHVGFCEDHAGNWDDVDHITLDDGRNASSTGGDE
jgi:hypothetical protein